jgi:short-subunit dehydrogenase
MSAYAASKAAVNAYVETLAAECRGSGVKIRCVCPSRADTPHYRRLAAEDPRAMADHRRIMGPSVVVNAVERSLGGDRLFVFPGYDAKAAVVLRRHFPRLRWTSPAARPNLRR